ncbi:MAG: SRPBCC family protein [Gemmatirosa sp.]
MARTADGSATMHDGGSAARPTGRRARQAREETARGSGTNVNGLERGLSVAAGGALAAYALKRKDMGGLVLGLLGGMLLERGVTGHCVAYSALGVSSAGDGGGVARTDARQEYPGVVQQHGRAAVLDAQKAIKIERSVTIFGHSRSEIYGFWRQLENLPRIFKHLESVAVQDSQRSHWVAKAPAGRTVSWEAEIVNEIPDELLAWKSLPGARVPNAGSVRFTDAPAGRGVEVKVVLEYEPPAGKVGMAVARMLGEEPDIQVREDLRRYKQLLETGELPVSENPGQGKRAREASFNAQVSTGQTGAPLDRLQERATQEAHEPQHVPQPGDAERGINTTEPATWEARS